MFNEKPKMIVEKKLKPKIHILPMMITTVFVSQSNHYQGGGEKTVIKSIILKKYIRAYLSIMDSNWKGNKCYVGTHSGTGYTVAHDVTIPGSAKRALDEDFDRYYFYEKNPENFEKLVNTINELIDESINIETVTRPETGEIKCATSENANIQVTNTDCNKGVRRLVDSTSQQNHWLVFIDPEGFSVNRKLVEQLLKRGNVDLFINFQTTGIYRNLSEYESRVEFTIGENYPREADMDALVKWYKEDLFEQNGYSTRSKELTSKGNNWRYDLIFASEADVANKIVNQIFDGGLSKEATDLIVEHRDGNECNQLGLENFDISVREHGQFCINDFT